MVILVFDRISKRYGQATALSDVSFDVHRGEILACSAPTAPARSTLIRILMDIIRADEGEIRVFGEPRTRDHLDRLGYLPEERGLYRKQTVVDVMTYFGSLKGLSRSDGSNMREAQQFAMVWSLIAALPLITMSVLIRDPHGVFARVMTWLPITAAPLVIFRSSLDPVSLAWWEIAGAITALAISGWLGIRIGARLFRIGVLNSGSRPSLRDIIRQARLPA